MVIGFQVRCEKSLVVLLDRKATAWRREQEGNLRNMAVHHNADLSYAQDAIRLLERVR